MFNNVALNQRRRGFSGCGLGALNLAINKSNFVIGEAPGYSITGAPINAPILWSSTRNGLPTGENQSGYGQSTDGLGVWSGSGGNFTIDQQGYWTKTATVGDESGTVAFQVLPQGGSQTVPYTPPSGVLIGGGMQVPKATANDGWLSGDFDLGGYKIPKIAAYAAVGFIAFTMMGKRK
jgi:hypothetical protein